MLQQKINELLDDTERTIGEMNNDKGNFPDPSDRATHESDRNFELRIRDRERKLIGKL
jgi:DnaK suppressor protein